MESGWMECRQVERPELLQLAQWAGAEASPPVSLTALGNQALLAARKTALLCSRVCPGEVILRVYDLARRLRASDLTFISGFHTPVERDFLRYLLGGQCRLIVCPARSIDGMRLPTEWRAAMEAGRLLVLSPFTAASHRRQSARLAARRNELVVALAEQVLLLHAAPGGLTEQLARAAAQSGKPLVTPELDDDVILRRLAAAPDSSAERFE
jgi:predicted Rossmann fold nucleotide-binding protein DprA/Smf involved in DNA uptake